MLRYVFDDAKQIQNHLHLTDGHALFFFGNASAPGLGGERVMLDVELGSAGQHALLRGTVCSRVAHSGVWLDLREPALLRRLREQEQLGARKQRRFGADILIELKSVEHGTRQIGKLVDVSAGGARVSGCTIAPGAELVARLAAPPLGVPAEVGLARAVRSGGSEVALEFHRKDPQTRAAISALIEAMDSQWRRAPLISHPAQCCGPSGVLDPPLPRTRPRD